MAELLGNRDSLYPEAKKSMDTGPVADRLRFIVVAGELRGPAEALSQLQALQDLAGKNGIELTEDQRAVIAALGRLYADRGGGGCGAAAPVGLMPAEGQPWIVLGQVGAANAEAHRGNGRIPRR